MTTTVTIEHEGSKFEVEVEYSPYIPARTNCPNEDATPAEGGLEGVNSVKLLDSKGKHVDLPDFLQEYLDTEVIENERFDEEINDALTGG